MSHGMQRTAVLLGVIALASLYGASGAVAALTGVAVKHLDPILARNQVSISGKALAPKRALGFFDNHGIDGWGYDGDNMFLEPSGGMPYLQPPISGFVGVGLIDSYDLHLGDATVGNLSSGWFRPIAGDYLGFLVGGGATPQVGVELKLEDRTVQSWRGQNTEVLAFVLADLTPYAGRRCYVHVYDSSTGPWGHILADHFMLLH